MGTTWSRWLEGDLTFDKKRFVDAKAQRMFYSALKLAAAAIEQAAIEEKATTLEADATTTGEENEMEQLQYVLENWAREACSMYDRVGDFPLILPMPKELHAPEEARPPAGAEEPPQSQEELMLKATSSDKMATADRLHEAIQRVAKQLPQDEFLRVLARYPRATRLFLSHELHVKADAELPFRLWTSTGKYEKAAFHVGKLAYGEESFSKKMDRLQEMAGLLQRAQEEQSASSRDRANASFSRVMTEEMIELIDTQNRLENRLGVMHLIGSSVVETIHKLLTLFPTVPTALSSAVAIGEDFNIHPRQFWWCLTRILPARGQWRTLFMLSGAVPPPFGYVPIAEAVVEAGRGELLPELLACVASTKEREAVAAFLALHPSDSTDAGSR